MTQTRRESISLHFRVKFGKIVSYLILKAFANICRLGSIYSWKSSNHDPYASFIQSTKAPDNFEENVESSFQTDKTMFSVTRFYGDVVIHVKTTLRS